MTVFGFFVVVFIIVLNIALVYSVHLNAKNEAQAKGRNTYFLHGKMYSAWDFSGEVYYSEDESGRTVLREKGTDRIVTNLTVVDAKRDNENNKKFAKSNRYKYYLRQIEIEGAKKYEKRFYYYKAETETDRRFEVVMTAKMKMRLPNADVEVDKKIMDEYIKWMNSGAKFYVEDLHMYKVYYRDGETGHDMKKISHPEKDGHEFVEISLSEFLELNGEGTYTSSSADWGSGYYHGNRDTYEWVERILHDAHILKWDSLPIDSVPHAYPHRAYKVDNEKLEAHMAEAKMAPPANERDVLDIEEPEEEPVKEKQKKYEVRRHVLSRASWGDEYEHFDSNGKRERIFDSFHNHDHHVWGYIDNLEHHYGEVLKLEKMPDNKHGYYVYVREPA